MENKVIYIIIVASLSITIYYNYKSLKKYDIDDYVKSHKICPITGTKTNYTACIQDPHLNNGFVVSVSSIDGISKIQKSLNNNDKSFLIKKVRQGYHIINNGKKQIIPKCEDTNKEDIMKKIDTKDIYSSI
tara:strand:+ start:575 stop:967 length:393 start_codon:yes stop_codon:yes gene_type:complete